MALSASWTLPGELAGLTVLHDFVSHAEETYLVQVS